jgi:hypothetical protein
MIALRRNRHCGIGHLNADAKIAAIMWQLRAVAMGGMVFVREMHGASSRKNRERGPGRTAC